MLNGLLNAILCEIVIFAPVISSVAPAAGAEVALLRFDPLTIHQFDAERNAASLDTEASPCFQRNVLPCCAVTRRHRNSAGINVIILFMFFY
jgi:hypothetical protein